MALVGDDEVEFLDGERGVVFDRDGFFEKGFGGLPPGHARVLPRYEESGALKAFDGKVVEIGRRRLLASGIPIVETMGAAAALNLGANSICLWLLGPFRSGDVNMASAWECSRNDVYEGGAVILTTLLVWLFSSGWPDLLVATALLVVFVRSATRVLRAASKQLRNEPVVAR